MQASLEASHSGQTGQVKSVCRTESNGFISPLQAQVASKAERREEAGEGRGTYNATSHFQVYVLALACYSPIAFCHGTSLS